MSTTALNDTPEAAVSGDGANESTRSGPRDAARTNPGASGPAPQPADTSSEAGQGAVQSIADMRVQIDAIDAELVRLIQRRTELSRAIGAMRASEGGTRIVYSREMKVLERFAALGSAGTDLGMLLLSMGRGRLGRR